MPHGGLWGLIGSQATPPGRTLLRCPAIGETFDDTGRSALRTHRSRLLSAIKVRGCLRSHLKLPIGLASATAPRPCPRPVPQLASASPTPCEPCVCRLGELPAAGPELSRPPAVAAATAPVTAAASAWRLHNGWFCITALLLHPLVDVMA